MASDDAEPGVEFLVEGSDGAQEELPHDPRRRDRSQRRVLAVGAAVLIGSVLIVHGFTGQRDQTASSDSSASSAPNGIDMSSQLAAPSPTGGLPTTRLPTGLRPDCPAEATCSVESGLPDAAMEALRGVFPHFVLRTASSLLVQRPGRFEPDLADRTLSATAGSDSITVRIRKPTDRADSDRRHRGSTGLLTDVTVTVPGFTVSIAVSQPSELAPISDAKLHRLASDVRLLLPQ